MWTMLYHPWSSTYESVLPSEDYGSLQTGLAFYTMNFDLRENGRGDMDTGLLWADGKGIGTGEYGWARGFGDGESDYYDFN